MRRQTVLFIFFLALPIFVSCSPSTMRPANKRMDSNQTSQSIPATSSKLKDQSSQQPASGKSDSVTTSSAATLPQLTHVALVVLENRSYDQVVNNSEMPYYNSLLRRYGLATNYFATTHPSIGNYFMLTTGQIVTRNDSFSGTTAVNSIVDVLTQAGKTWKAYAEGLPSVGYIGGSKGRYLKRHNPFAYFVSVQASTTERLNLVPASELSVDIAKNALPNFAFIIPDACNDAHDCSLATADRWLQQHIDPLITDSKFKQSGLLIIVFDEGREDDRSHGGGHDSVLLIGDSVKPGYQSEVFYQHQNILRTILQVLGVPNYPGAAATATPMDDFFLSP